MERDVDLALSRQAIARPKQILDQRKNERNQPTDPKTGIGGHTLTGRKFVREQVKGARGGQVPNGEGYGPRPFSTSYSKTQTHTRPEKERKKSPQGHQNNIKA